MKNVTCHLDITNKALSIFRGNTMIGIVVENNDKSDVIINLRGTQELSFNDIAIIQDCWNQFNEIDSANNFCN